MHNYRTLPGDDKERRSNREVIERAVSWEMYNKFKSPHEFCAGPGGSAHGQFGGFHYIDMPATGQIRTAFKTHKEWRSGALTFRVHYTQSAVSANNISLRCITDPLKNGVSASAASPIRRDETYSIPYVATNIKASFCPDEAGSTYVSFAAPITQDYDMLTFTLVRGVDACVANFRFMGLELIYLERDRYIG